jgi:O-antigen/teichoic acid export membrane protein
MIPDSRGVLVSIHRGWGRIVGLLRSSLYVDSFYLMAANVVGAGFGFLFWTGAARLYDPRDVGLAGAAISAIGLLAAVSTLGLDFAMIRFLPHATDRQGIINSSLTIGASLALLLSLVFLWGAGIWSPGLVPSRTNLAFVVFLVIATISMTMMSLLNSVFLARRQANMVCTESFIFGATKVSLAALLAIVWRPVGLVGAWALGLVAAVIGGFALFLPRAEGGRHQLQVTLNRKVLNDMTHFAFANYLSAVLWGAPTYLLPLLVVTMAGREANAYFYVAFSVSGLLSVIPTAVSLSLFAHGSHNESELVDLTLASLKFSVGLLGIGIIAVLLLGGKLLLLFGKAYSIQGTELLWLLALASIPITVNSLYFSVLRVQNRMGPVILYMVAILGATLALSSILLPRFGLMGAGAAVLVAHGIVASWIAILFLLRRLV